MKGGIRGIRGLGFKGISPSGISTKALNAIYDDLYGEVEKINKKDIEKAKKIAKAENEGGI